MLPNDDEHKRQASRFLQAARDYREWVKRNRREQLHGVMWVISDSDESVVYTESEKYAVQLQRLVFDGELDVFRIDDLTL